MLTSLLVSLLKNVTFLSLLSTTNTMPMRSDKRSFTWSPTKKMWHEFTQSDTDDQSQMLFWALSNHIHEIIVNAFNAADDPSMLS